MRRAIQLKKRRNERAARAKDDLRVDNARPAAALGCFLTDQLSLQLVIDQGDLVCQAAIHQRIVLTPKFLAPYPIFDLPLKNFFQAESRDIFTPD
jgi:hypothetical protein